MGLQYQNTSGKQAVKTETRNCRLGNSALISTTRQSECKYAISYTSEILEAYSYCHTVIIYNPF